MRTRMRGDGPHAAVPAPAPHATYAELGRVSRLLEWRALR
jgi:hypothetical protein